MTDKQDAAVHKHDWKWTPEWWGAHVCDCGESRESPPIDPAEAATPAADDALRAALENALSLIEALLATGGPAPGTRTEARQFIQQERAALAQQRSEPVGLDVERLALLQDWSAHQLKDRHVELCELCNAFLDAAARLSEPQP